MKKYILTVMFGAGLSVLAIAQTAALPYTAKPRLSVGVEFALPTGNFGDVFSIGFGGSGKFEVPITKQLYGTATAGFTAFYLKENEPELSSNKSYVPLKAGAKYYFGKYFYGEGELGVSIGTNQNAGSALAWSPGAGVSYPITKDGYLDAGLRYERWMREGGNINQVGIRVAYKF